MASLVSLPMELLLSIMEYVDAPSDVNALSQTCHYLRDLFNHELYAPILQDPSSYDVLQTAASKCTLECVRHLLSVGIPVNSIKDPEKVESDLSLYVAELPIYKALIHDRPDMIQLLIEYGALDDHPAGESQQSFKEAVLLKSVTSTVRRGSVQILDIFIEHGALQKQDVLSFISMAGLYGHAEIIDRLHPYQPDFNFDSEECRGLLRDATLSRDRHMISLLLNKGCNPYEPDPDGEESAFRMAAGIGIPVFNCFLTNGASAHRENPRLCLEAAIKGVATSVVEYFLVRQRVFRIQDRSVVKMLGDILPGSIEIARLMLGRITADQMDRLIAGGRQRREHLFNAACVAGDSNLLSRLFAADDNERRGPGIANKTFIYRKLVAACACNQTATVRALLGIPRVRNVHSEEFSRVNGVSLITLAVNARSTDIIDVLLEMDIYDFRGLDENRMTEDARSILKTAVSSKWRDLASRILSNMYPGSSILKKGTFIQRAVGGGLEMLSMVMDAGAKLDPSEDSHWAALQIAAELGDTRIVSKFLENEFDVTDKWHQRLSFSPLVLAVRPLVRFSYDDAGVVEALEFYLDKGASLEARFGNGQTPILQLIERVSSRHNRGLLSRVTVAITYLLRKGADPFATDSDGDDLIVKAARSPHIKLVQDIIGYFVEKGDDFEVYRKSLKKAALLASPGTSRWIWRFYWDHMYKWDDEGKIIST